MRIVAFAVAFVLVVVAAAVSESWAEERDLTVNAEFPGGNIIVDKIDGDHIQVHQDLRDTAGDWFYWCFRVRGAAGRNLRVSFTRSSPIGVRGPAVSTDGGKTWEWLGREAVDGKSFRCAVPAEAEEIRFGVAFPYQDANLQEFLDRVGKSPHAKVEPLSKTRKGRDVQFLRLGRLDGKAEHRVALTCRHHSCEMMASYALEGIVNEVLSDSEDGKWLREHVEFFIVPMMDKDGVEDGDQGKNRKPHDHNRDYEGEGIYPPVRAVKERLPAWSQGKLRIAMDMHCPGLRGGESETVYFVGPQDDAIWAETQRLSKILQTVQTGPIAFNGKSNLPFGKSWNNAANGGNAKAFGRWSATIPGVRIATTIEIAYANANGRPVTDESARALGHDLARAMRKYLEELPEGSGDR